MRLDVDNRNDRFGYGLPSDKPVKFGGASLGSVLLWLAIFGGVCVSAIVTGLVAAIMPPKVAIALGGLIGVGGVFLVALMVPDKMAAPEGLIRRLLNLYLLVWVVWPLYVTYKLGPLPAMNPTRLLMWMLILLFAFWLIASRHARNQLFERLARQKLFALLFLGYFGWQILCAALAEQPIGSLYYLFKGFASGVVLFLIAIWALRDQRDVEAALTWSLWAALICALMGVLEMIKGANLFMAILPTDPDQLEVLSKVVGEKLRSGSYRVSASFAHPLTYAEYMLMAMPVAAYMVARGATRGRRLLGLAVLPMALVAVYISHTRSSVIGAGMLAIMIATYIGIVGLRKKTNILAASAGAFTLCCVVFAMIVGGAFAIDLAQGRNRDEAGSTSARMFQLTQGMHALAEQPIMGYGPGGAGEQIGLVPGASFISVDNYYLNVVLDTGLPGLLMYILVFFCPIGVALRFGLAAEGPANVLSLAIAAALIAFTLEKVALSLAHNLDYSYLLMAMMYTMKATTSPPEKKALR